MNLVRKSLLRYDGGIWIRVIGAALTTITGFMIRPFLVLYLYDRLESVLLPMLVVALQPLCGLFVSWFGGGMSDRLGRKPVMIAALLLQAASMAGYVFADAIWQFAAVSVLNGIGQALFMPASNAQMTDMVPAERRAEVYALLHTAFNVGAAIGPMLGLALFRWNPQIVFFIAAGATCAYTLLVAFKMEETAPAVIARKSSGEKGLPSLRGGRQGGLKLLFRKERTLLAITLLSLPVSLLYTLAETAMPIHLQAHFDHSQAVFAGMLTFNGLAVIALQIWIARKTERMSSYKLIGCSYALFSIVAIGYGYSTAIVALYAAEFIFTIGEMIYGPHIQKEISLMAEEERRGFYFAVFGASRLLAAGIGPIAAGLAMEWANGETLFTVVAVLIVACGIGAFRLLRKQQAAKRTEQYGAAAE
ncbi:MDR family MFS transporter [Cohnella faecalis]|uniref:MFS transporter n=1 Tax=Cohnella faecalis TaxID=2315694 RepID=A0A398CKJ8_9BACL|nr:MFS transporter [Cohnella faecalis]RIE02895.1 MFS transporter [Cohnella faecalis]